VVIEQCNLAYCSACISEASSLQNLTQGNTRAEKTSKHLVVSVQCYETTSGTVVYILYLYK
jgi:hypothetical protein